MTQTYLMIKPEAVRASVWPDILQIVLRNRFRVRRLEMRRMSRDVAQRFYAEHEGKGFFSDLIEYITSGDVIAVRLEAEDAVPRLRQLVGATNPAQATPGTIRAMYGTSLQENAVHASDSDASAERELGIIFPG
ncbi:MAG: nucleoside-diphosphate kinase [Candidatus Latescibacterota bacterium]|nr:MAG: nucleoside-diphosphate kinase [Candidatus Latescibacterota bacterium]